MLALYTLRILHVVIGVFWVGAVLFIGFFLTASVRAAGPAGGAVMQQLMVVRAVPRWLMASAILTIVSGLGLYWHNSGGFQSAWLGSGAGAGVRVGRRAGPGGRHRGHVGQRAGRAAARRARRQTAVGGSSSDCRGAGDDGKARGPAQPGQHVRDRVAPPRHAHDGRRPLRALVSGRLPRTKGMARHGSPARRSRAHPRGRQGHGGGGRAARRRARLDGGGRGGRRGRRA